MKRLKSKRVQIKKSGTKKRVTRENKIRNGAKDFAVRFEAVMRELANG